MTMTVFPHFKLQGEWAELLFMARAAELGFAIAKPWGDSSPYDVAIIINNRIGSAKSKPCCHEACPERLTEGKEPKGPGLLRIQIKSTRCLHSNRAYKCHIDSNGVPYTLRDLDFIAAYVIPVKVWYIIPLAATRGQSEVLLAPHRPNSKYAKFKEAWHLLRSGK